MDKIIRALICGGSVSLTVMDTTKLVGDAITIHKTDEKASRIFGGLLTGGAYLAALLKSENTGVSITVKAKDGDGAVSVSSDSALHVRGYADGSCTRTLAGGILTVIREEDGAMPFVGACEIVSDDVSDIFATYFQQSEQLPTAVAIITEIGADGKCECAGGVIIQLLPDADDDAINEAERALNCYMQSENALSKLGADGVYEKFFSNLASGEKYELYPEYKCNCSEEKIKKVLASVGKEELLKIAKEQGNISVHCHYCNKDYVYDKEAIEKTF